MLFLRSQNKEDLMQMDDMSVDKSKIRKDGYVIVCYRNGVHCNLGEYSSKEKSLRVLDEIQMAYNCCMINKAWFTYDLPEEEIKEEEEEKPPYTKADYETAQIVGFDLDDDEDYEEYFHFYPHTEGENYRENE